MLKYFSTSNGSSIAVNPNHVISVYETDVNGHKVTNIVVIDGTIHVSDSMLDVVARLNEQ